MLVPPDREAARPPPPPAAAPSAAARAGRPQPLDPDLDKRLRRQRAQQYGRAVRQGLAAWHTQHEARRRTEAEAQRERWEEQRAARLAHLAERQMNLQQEQEQRHAAPPCLPKRGDGTPLAAANAALSAAAPRAAKQLEAVPAKTIGAASPARPTQASRRPPAADAAAASTQRRSACQPLLKQASQQLAPEPEPSSDACSVAPLATAASSCGDAPTPAPPPQQPAQPADPLAALLAELLAAESGGDPYSVVNLFVEEQLAQQQEQEQQQQQREQQQQQQQQIPTQAEAAPAAGAASAAHPLVSRAAQAGEAPLLPLEQQQLARTQSAPPAAMAPRHRRSSSLLLPQFESVAELACAAGTGEAAGAEQQEQQRMQSASAAPGPSLQAGLPSAAALRPPLSPRLQPQQLQPLPPQDALPPAQDSSAKQLYVRQWLHSSAADVQASPPASSAGYSADPEWAGGEEDDEEEGGTEQQPAVARSPETAADTAAAAEDAAAAPAADQLGTLLDSPAAMQQPAAAAAAAPSTVPGAAPALSSRDASTVTSGRRPGAPMPPSSGSQPDGGTSLSASVEFGLPVAWAPARPQPLDGAEEAAGRRAAGTSEPDGGSGDSWGSPEPAAAAEGASQQRLEPEQAPEEEWEEEEEEEEEQEERPQLQQPEQPAGRGSESDAASSAAGRGRGAAGKGGSAALAAAYSSDFDSEFGDAEISFGQGDGADAGADGVVIHGPGGAAAACYASGSPDSLLAAGAAAATAGLSAGADGGTLSPRRGLLEGAAAEQGSGRPRSPRMVSPWQGGSPPGSAHSQRPRSPHHAALDDPYPGSPPASAGSAALRPALPAAPSSRPLSPLPAGGSRPASPRGEAPAEADEASPLQLEDTVEVHSPTGSSGSGASGSGSGSGSGATDRLLREDGRGSPYAMHRFGLGQEEEGEEEEAAAAAGVDTEAMEGGSPPGTPLASPPPAGEDPGSCPGSARVDDDTVVQTEEHVREYVGEVMAHFWAERADAFAAGATPPLDLDGFLAIERRRPACGDPQHIFNKLLFDAANEALAAHYVQALNSYAGRLDPRLALLSPQLLERQVAQRVLRWAALGGGGGDVSAMLSEDALEDDRALARLTAALQAEQEAAAGAGQAAIGGAPSGDDGGAAAAGGQCGPARGAGQPGLWM